MAGPDDEVAGVGHNALRELVDAIVAVGSDLDLSAMLKRLVTVATELVGAQYGALGVLDPGGTRLEDLISVGVDDEMHRLIGDLPEGKGVLGVLIVDAQPIRLPDIEKHADSYGFPSDHPPMKSFLGVPIRVRGAVFGNLYLTNKIAADAFTEVDEELSVGLAAAAGVAIENARLHNRVQELAVVEDRERIARDLHDTVIQRLFATGLSLQATARTARSDPASAAVRIDAAVDDLDITIKHIRSAIFALESSRGGGADLLHNRVLATIEEFTSGIELEPFVLLDGPIDTGVPDEIAEEMMAVLREALSNAARHSGATRVTVEVSVGDLLTVRVIDNGKGLQGEPRADGHGLRNMAARAGRHGGSLELAPAEDGGFVVEWSVPVRGYK
ncbi:MAG TPA: GAF domain-containing sensor histidine kinase [Acidimicrobiales bacterium]|nr:GAF domain-containing sensor histidine kinase [Acidimicrobiales bacterium]